MSVRTPHSSKKRRWLRPLQGTVVALFAFGIQTGCDSGDPPGSTVDCENGATESRACGTNGTQSRTCEQGSWSAFSNCEEGSATGCTDGDTRAASCPSGTENGTEKCDAGTWKPDVACTPVVACNDGETRPAACASGTENGTEICLSGSWSTDTPCTPITGPCIDGYSRPAECPAGSADGIETCEDGEWKESTPCEVTGSECTEDMTTFACGYNDEGEKEIVCKNGYIISEGTCDDPDVCENGKTRNTDCGTNGLIPQKCENGQWKNTGTCQEFCVNGTTDTTSCGLNGSGVQNLVCQNGDWINQGTCNDPDVCKNGTSQKIDCGSAANRGDFGSISQSCTGGQWTGSTCSANDIALAPRTRRGCAVRNSGHVVCWGVNGGGQLGQGHENDVANPVNVKNLTGVVEVVLSNVAVCARTGAGDVYCWGANSYGQLGNNSDQRSSLPVKVPGLSKIRALTAGHNHFCALKEDNTVACWGNNSKGQLGIDSLSDRWTPTQVLNLSNIGEIYAGNNTTCARKRSNILLAGAPNGTDTYCWGDNENRTAGILSSTTNILTPQRITQHVFESVAIAGNVFCGLTTSRSQIFGPVLQRLQCVGRASASHGDGNGEVNRTSFNTALFQESNTSRARIKGSGNGRLQGTMCALDTQSRLHCWGSDQGKSLGRGNAGNLTTAEQATPRMLSYLIPSLPGLPSIAAYYTNILNFAVGGYSVCTINTDGVIMCTGEMSSNATKRLGVLANIPAKP